MKHKIAKIFILAFIIFFSVGIGIVSGKVLATINNTNLISMHALTKENRSSLLYAKNSNGQWINIGVIHGVDNRIWVPINKIPKNLQNAFVAIEDQRFYTNNLGIDPRGILRALIADIKAGGKPVEGASTITQQLVKNTMLSKISSQKTLIRKIKEAILSWQLEQKYSKQQILEAYLNTIYLGGPNLNIYGVQAASLAYFDKNVNQLDLAQSAMIAGITNDPLKYSPYASKTYSVQRQHLVLQKMLQLGFITKSQYNQAINEKLVYKKSRLLDYNHEYFIDQVINDAAHKLQQNLHISYNQAIDKLYNGGLKIYTTMDLNIQSTMEKAFANPNLFPVNSHIKDKVQGAMVVMDWKTGEVKGIVGGRNSSNQQRVFNRATQAFRQPGSSIKPLTVYAPALENGFTPSTIINDTPITINGWSPHNYEKTYSGPVTLEQALTNSLNIPAVKIVNTIGINTSAKYGKRFGLNITKQDMYLPALALGGLFNGVSPLQEASAYGAIANNGIYITPVTFTKIEDSQNNIILENKPVKRYVMSKQNAYFLENMMQDVVKYGTGTHAALPNMPVAGKTGTTDNYDNAWFTGFTPYYVGSVWMGFDNNRRIIDDNIGPVVGGTFPAELWKAVMLDIHKGLKPINFPIPKGIVSQYPTNQINPNINPNTQQVKPNNSQNSQSQNITIKIPNINNGNTSNSINNTPTNSAKSNPNNSGSGTGNPPNTNSTTSNNTNNASNNTGAGALPSNTTGNSKNNNNGSSTTPSNTKGNTNSGTNKTGTTTPPNDTTGNPSNNTTNGITSPKSSKSNTNGK